MTQPTFDKKKLESEITQRLDSFVTPMNELSEEELQGFYSDDPTFYWVEDGHLQYTNKKSLVVALTGLTQSADSTNLRVLQRKIDILRDDTAMLFLEYEQSIFMKPGFELDLDCAMTILLKKEEGVWNFLSGHSSTKKQRQG